MSAPPKRRRRRLRPHEVSPDPRDWDPEHRLPDDHPAHPSAPLTEMSYAYSESAERGFERLNKAIALGQMTADYRNVPRALWPPQPPDPEHEAALVRICGSRRKRADDIATTYHDDLRPCARCGELVLHIDRLRGDVLTVLSLCECHLPEVLQVRGREIRAAAAALTAKQDAEAEENRRKGEAHRKLLRQAQGCASDHLARWGRCIDRAQSFPECAVCTLKIKAVTQKREREQKRNGKTKTASRAH